MRFPGRRKSKHYFPVEERGHIPFQRSVRAHPRATELDCRTCGACCAPEVRLPFYVGLKAADLRRLTRAFRDRNVARGSLLTRLDPVGRCVCVALKGTLGRRVSCTVYPRRPRACRGLTEGSRACRKARRQAGLV
ncbi:MAG: YkgJ family cysteine cluster protein [Deltaproteobacteria bacterium]|nr:YkgJ family cysteine cluster protein [Deltaproteobacteria bacterium]